MSASGWYHLDVEEIVGETDKAFCLKCDDVFDKPMWFPKSQISEPEAYAKGDKNVTVSLTEWIAEQKGLDI